MNPVEKVEGFYPELKHQTFGEMSIFEQRQVEVSNPWCPELIVRSRFVAESEVTWRDETPRIKHPFEV